MKQRKRMGLPTVPVVASRRTRVRRLPIAGARTAVPDAWFVDETTTNDVAATAEASSADTTMTNGASALPDRPFEDNAIVNAANALPDASSADNAMIRTVAAAPDGSFADNTITKLMARLDDAPRGETASQQRRPLPSAPAKFQPKVLRTRANRT
ncbi:MAG: hypothetical protein ACM3SX_12745 [Deltaproteobacteria bacterium]